MKSVLGFLFVVFSIITTTNLLHAQWIQTTEPYGGTVNSIVVSGTNLFAGTYDGGVWRAALSEMTPLTQDWVSQSSGVSNTLNAIKAVSENVAWVCGLSGTVLRTTDGGRTWIKTASPSSILHCYSIDAFDANTAWVVVADPLGGNTALYGTTNGGSTWRQQLASNASGSFYDAVRFYDANTGILLGDPENGYFVIYTTTDGGTTWTRSSQSSIPAPISVEYGITNNLAIFGNGAWFGTHLGSTRIFRSTDRGKSWSSSGIISGIGSYLVSTSFASDTVGLEMGSNGSVVQTKDGGKSWSNAIRSGVISPGEVVLVTPTIAIMVGDNGSASSTDAGSTWTFSFISLHPLRAVSFASSSTGWAVGLAGTILKWNGGNLGGAPLVITDAASNVSSTSSILNATVRPNGLSTTAYFEWGTSSSLSSFSTTTSLPIGSGISAVSVMDTLKGLSGNTTYYYRVVGQNTSGTERGSIVAFTTALTLVGDISNEMLTEHTLSQNFPNPFNPTTRIEFALPRNESVTLKLFNLVGEEIETLVSERLSAGRYQVQWNASGRANGVYFYRFVAGQYVQTKKLILLK